MIASIDWSHRKPLCLYIKNKVHCIEFKNILEFLKENDVDIVVGENIPTKLLLTLLEHKIKIFRCRTNLVSEYREEKNIEKTDGNDAKSIYELYLKNPLIFHEYDENDKKFLRAKQLCKLRESIQKSRLQYEYKFNAYKNFFSFDADIVDKINSIYKELLSKEQYLDRQFNTEYFKKYVLLFDDIIGIGVVSIATIVSEIGDINRFPNKKSFLNYVFGYKNCNYNHKLKTKFLRMVRLMFIHKNTFYTSLYYKYKKELQEKHPEKIVANGKTKYNPSHFTALAERRVARKIAELIYTRLKKYSKIDSGIPMLSSIKSIIKPMANTEIL